MYLGDKSMLNSHFKSFREFFNAKNNLKIAQAILGIIAVYYFILTGFYLVFLLPIILMWAAGSNDFKFFNVISSESIQRTDISYFTTGDILDVVKLLIIIIVLVSLIVVFRKVEKKLS
jgi:hypothetical protein